MTLVFTCAFLTIAHDPLTMRCTGRMAHVGSDTEEDGGSTPPAPTTHPADQCKRGPLWLVGRIAGSQLTTLIDEFVTDELWTLGFGRSGDRAAKPHGERDAVVPAMSGGVSTGLRC